MIGYTFFDLINDIFEEVKKPLSEKEIWEYAVKQRLDKKVNSKGKTPWKTIAARIYVDIRDNSNSQYVKVGKRPTRFYLKKYFNKENRQILEQKLEKVEKESENIRGRFKERDLHPLLVKFVNEDLHFKAYSRTIYHEISSKGKKGKNEWLHPDIVSVYFPFQDFDNLTTEVQRALSVNSIKIYSFEMKIKIGFSNLRQYYFQAVSNSSWANEGYLVCLDLEDDSDFANELQRLNNAFGIGLIRLNHEDISQSEIVLPAKEKNELDWTTIDRLIEENHDFERFFKDITEDFKIGKVKSKYDEVKKDDKMIGYIQEKGIEI
ncbi:HTH domain-containing protein [Clostridium aestuarii]|uniref:HTH domain-containing protein n=1 Tax=Clostridium aestuarii TaxID=338193 RepID=A0ABT4D540_9CLOT|nr:HTH domain-containing protein [Clostridium aestuarii]MCY6485330.1 HTH domain-containing protein [Clostridium aestuarii]